MKSEWLTAASFERASEILSAISTLSIHAKLQIARVQDPTPLSEVEQARMRLVEFLQGLQTLVERAERDRDKIIVGADPRFGEFALQYLSEKRRLPLRSIFFRLPLSQIEELIKSDRSEDLPDLVACLESLRGMVEQFAQVDIAAIFDEE